MTTIKHMKDGSPTPAEMARRASIAAAEAKRNNPKPESKNKCIRYLTRAGMVLNSNWVQTPLYLLFVILFQSLSQTMRHADEFLVDKHVMDRLIENHFDSSHNTFNDVRRVGDIWEWGNNVLWPGLFSDAGPCHEPVGSRDLPKDCNDDAWPDGDGSFGLGRRGGVGATPFGIETLVERMDLFDWTEGITIRQMRVSEGDCPTTTQLGPCLPEVPFGGGATAPFGYNWTHPLQPLAHPFTHFTSQQLGSNPDGMVSAAIPSMKTYETAGYIAVVIPFFSDSFLPLQEGTSSEVTDYRLHYVNTTNGRRARYHCVRTSLNGLHIRQLCDPAANGDGTGALTGAVRREVETFWNDLKRGHWIDTRTRLVAIFGQFKSNQIGVRYRITLMFELTALGKHVGTRAEPWTSLHVVCACPLRCCCLHALTSPLLGLPGGKGPSCPPTTSRRCFSTPPLRNPWACTPRSRW